MTPEEFYAKAAEVGLPTAYGEAVGRPEWSVGLARYVPEHMHEGVCNYVLYGTRPGSFLTAVLKNDLMNALRRADDINKHALHDWGMFLTNYAPYKCFGSPDNFDRWRGIFV